MYHAKNSTNNRGFISNELSGTIPTEIGSMTNLQQL